MENTETIYALLGLIMIYSWIHIIVICFKKLTGLTQYEKIVSWVAFVGFVIFILGFLTNN